MHIVLWQNALCTFDSSFLRFFSNCGKFCCKSLSIASVATFCKTDVFPINLKNFGWCKLPT